MASRTPAMSMWRAVPAAGLLDQAGLGRKRDGDEVGEACPPSSRAGGGQAFPVLMEERELRSPEYPKGL